MNAKHHFDGLFRAAALAAITGALLLGAAPAARAQLEWRVSVKFILGPNNEFPCCGNYDSYEDITNRVNEANVMLRRLGRGYEYRLSEVTTVAGISQWFEQDRDQAHALEAAAEAAPATYKWRTDAMNVYINNWDGTAICSFPNSPSGQNDMVFFGQASFTTSFAHEAGHYFDLLHTFQNEDFRNANGSACDQTCMCAQVLPGNGDLVADTIGDVSCWGTQNAIAQGNYGVNYNAPGCDNAAVDRVYFNVMSYRTNVRNLLTEDQLDRMTDTANGARLPITSGRTRFVATTGNDTGSGSSTQRYRTLFRGLEVAQPGDIVLLTTGNYNEPRTINQHVTLRATRGPVSIGRP